LENESERRVAETGSSRSGSKLARNFESSKIWNILNGRQQFLIANVGITEGNLCV
jgi:hypothetical protein